MRRGMQGHMAEPREPTQALVWRRGDTCARHTYIYLYIIVIMYKRPDYRNSLTIISVAPYKLDLSL